MSGNYNNANTRIRTSFQPAGLEGRWSYGTWIQHRLRSEGPALKMTPIQLQSFTPGGQAPGVLHGGFEVQGNVDAHFEPEGLAPYLALFQQRAATPQLLATGAYRHILSTSQTGPDFRSRRLAMQIYRDEEAVQSAYGGVCSGFNLTMGKRTVIDAQAQTYFPRLQYFDEPVQSNGASTDPVFRGLPRIEVREAEGTAGDLEIEAMAVPGTGGADFDVRFTLAGETAGPNVVPIFAGEWARVNLSQADRFAPGDSGYGKRPSHVEVMWPDSAGVAVGDTWDLAKHFVGPWADALPPVKGMSTIETEVYLDGELVSERGSNLESLNLTASITPDPDDGFGSGGPWAGNVLTRGIRTINWALSRKMFSPWLVHRLESFEPLHLDVRMYHPERIAGTEHEYRARWVCPRVRIDGTRPTSTDPNTKVENYNLIADPPTAPDAEGFGDDLTVVLDNALSDLAA